MKKVIYLQIVPPALMQAHIGEGQRLTITSTPVGARTLKVPHKSLPNLAQECLRERGLRVANPLQAHRQLQRAVRAAVAPSDVEGTARAIAPALQVILRSGTDLHKLETVAQRRIQQLARVGLMYKNALAESGWIDSSELLWHASRHPGTRQPLLIYGYFNPRRDELAFIDAIAAAGSAMVLPCGDDPLFAENQQAVEWLQGQGWQVAEAVTAPPTLGDRLQHAFLEAATPAHCIAYTYPNLEAEVRGTLARVKQLLSQGVSARAIALAVRDEVSYGPTVLDVAWEYELPVRALYATPLKDTRLGAWVQLLLQAIEEGFPFEVTAKLLRHPLGAKLDRDTWPNVRATHPAGLAAWQQHGIDLSPLNWPASDTRENWVQRLQQTFDEFFELRRRAGRWAREIVAYYTLQEQLVQLAKPEREAIAFADFARDILDTLALLTVPAQPGRGGVELHSPRSVMGGSYEYVFVLGAAEGVLPAPVRDDPMLDFHARRSLIRAGFPLESAAAAARREAAIFYTLLHTPRLNLTLSYPQLRGKDPTLPSLYLSRLGVEPIPAPPQPVASWEEARRANLRGEAMCDDPLWPHAVRALEVERRRESAHPPDEYDGMVQLPIAPETHTFSASQIAALGQCPFKWFADRLLRLSELSEAEVELSPSFKGRLYHRSLEIAVRAAMSAEDIRQATKDQLDDAIAKSETELELHSVRGWQGQRWEHLQILQRAIAQSDFLSDDATILALEKTFEAEWLGLKIRGTLDRVDELSDGVALIDYKTGSSTTSMKVKDDSDRLSLDIQMPLYLQVAQNSLFPDKSVTRAEYYSLTQAKKLSKKMPDAETVKSILHQVKLHLEKGQYPVNPDINQQACRYCSFDLVCRKGARLSRKYRRSP